MCLLHDGVGGILPENPAVSTHNLEFQLPETLDTDYDNEAYFNYRVEYNLTDENMQTAALDKKIKEEIYKGYTVQYVHTGDQVFQISDNSWGIIVTATVKVFPKEGSSFTTPVNEVITLVLTGIEDKK